MYNNLDYHYFSNKKIDSLINGFENTSLDKFEEGTFPRKLFYVVNKKNINAQ